MGDGVKAREEPNSERSQRRRKVSLMSNFLSNYAQQTQAMNRMRGMLEDEATMKKAQMMKALQEEN